MVNNYSEFFSDKPLVSTYSEFQPLEEVIVGTPYDPNTFDSSDTFNQEAKDLLKRVLTETAEDLEVLVDILKKENIIVQRPKPLHNPLQKYTVGEFDIEYINQPLQPRDLVGFFGNKMIEAYTKDTSRYLETLCSRDILKEYYTYGAEWISMPQPQLNQKTYHDYWRHGEILFHSANLIKCGKDIFHSQSNQKDPEKGKGTEQGLHWYKQQLPEFKFNEVSVGGHVDGKIALLKPGLLMTWKKDWLPEKLKSWDCIIVDGKGTKFPEDFKNTRKQRFYKDYIERWLSHWIGYVDETVFDVNMLSLSEDKVICTGADKEVFKQLESKGVTPIYWKFRHQYFWDGGIHCLTSDIQREGDRESYL